MAVNWGDIYESIYLSSSTTVVANAFRKAVGLPPATGRGQVRAPRGYRHDRYRGWEQAMRQRVGVRG